MIQAYLDGEESTDCRNTSIEEKVVCERCNQNCLFLGTLSLS